MDLNGFELFEAGAPTDLNALLIGSVLVAAAGAAAGLGNVTAELEEGLKKPVDSESAFLSALPDVNAELIGFEGACLGAAEGAAEGLWNPLLAAGAEDGLWNPLLAAGAEGAVEGLWNPEEGVAAALGKPEAAGAGFSLGSGALNAELIGCTGSALGAVAAGVVCVLANPALGNPAVGAGFSLGSGALNAELMGCTGSVLAAGAAEGAGCVLAKPGLGNPEVAGAEGFGASAALGASALGAEGGIIDLAGSALGAAGGMIDLAGSAALGASALGASGLFV